MQGGAACKAWPSDFMKKVRKDVKRVGEIFDFWKNRNEFSLCDAKICRQSQKINKIVVQTHKQGEGRIKKQPVKIYRLHLFAEKR